jgi:hypothetical protein
LNLKFIKSFFLSSFWICVLTTCVYGQVLRHTNHVGGGSSSTTQSTKVDTIDQKPTAGIDSKVKYTAEDSIRFDRAKNVVYLYGKARVFYNDFELDADYIRLDQENNTVFAKGRSDPKTNRYRGKPIFKQGQESPESRTEFIPMRIKVIYMHKNLRRMNMGKVFSGTVFIPLVIYLIHISAYILHVVS